MIDSVNNYERAMPSGHGGLRINSHCQNIRESATLSINQEALRRRGHGEDICHLGFGQSPFPVHPKISSALAGRAHHKEYLSPQGLPELCHQVATYYQKRHYSFGPEQIFVGPGSKELIFDLLFLLEGPIYIPSPSWVSYGPMAQLLRRPVHFIPTTIQSKYKVTPSQLQSSVCSYPTSSQKILIINSPSNPTGMAYGRDEIEGLTEICRKYNILVIADEIYSEIYFGEEAYTSFSWAYPEGTFVTSGMSKFFSAGGYRLGLLATPESSTFKKSLRSLISETFSAVSTPIQYAAMVAYGDDPEINDYNNLCRQIHRACGLYCWRRFQEMGLDCLRPDGAFYLFVSFESFKKNIPGHQWIQHSSYFCFHLLEDHGVALLPGKDFYVSDDHLCARAAVVDYDGAKVLEMASLKRELDEQFVKDNCPRLVQAMKRIESFLLSDRF